MGTRSADAYIGFIGAFSGLERTIKRKRTWNIDWKQPNIHGKENEKMEAILVDWVI